MFRLQQDCVPCLGFRNLIFFFFSLLCFDAKVRILDAWDMSGWSWRKPNDSQVEVRSCISSFREGISGREVWIRGGIKKQPYSIWDGWLYFKAWLQYVSQKTFHVIKLSGCQCVCMSAKSWRKRITRGNSLIWWMFGVIYHASFSDNILKIEGL